MHACSGRARINYDDLSEADVRDLQTLAKRYVAGERLGGKV
jgi:hypothetical protein